MLEGWTIISICRAKQHQSSGGRDTRLIMTLIKMRGHSAGRHMENKEGDDEKSGSFPWRSTAMTQLCTVAVVHSGMEAFSKQEASVYSCHSLPSPSYIFSHSRFSYPLFSLPLSLHSFLFSIISSPSPQRPSLGKDELCCVWKQHLPGWLSQNRFNLISLSLWTGAQHGCHSKRNAPQICTLQIPFTFHHHCKYLYISFSGMRYSHFKCKLFFFSNRLSHKRVIVN